MKNRYYIKSVYVTNEYQEVFDELDKYCEKERMSKSYIICEAVKEYLKKLDVVKHSN